MIAQSRFVVEVVGRIEWHLGEAGDMDFTMVAFPSYRLLNPLYWTPDEIEFAQLHPLGTLDSGIGLSSRGLVFVTEDTDDSAFPSDLNVIGEVLRRLRYAARQFSIPRQIVKVSLRRPMTGPRTIRTTTDTPDDVSATFVRSYRMPAALTEDHLRQVAEMAADFAVPVHTEVLLDALEAHVEEDFRKALLYGAIAVEAFARQCLERQATLNLARSEARHRTISLPVSGGGRIAKDPISDLLLEADSFARLLHEAPLYVQGRSLLLDKPDTYRNMLRLYATRNKIAHVGAPSDIEKQFPVNRDGSREALLAAVETVAWFGDTGPYVVWMVSSHRLPTARRCSAGCLTWVSAAAPHHSPRACDTSIDVLAVAVWGNSQHSAPPPRDRS